MSNRILTQSHLGGGGGGDSGALYRLNYFVSMLHYCANLKPIRYESTSFDRIVADKSHRVIVA